MTSTTAGSIVRASARGCAGVALLALTLAFACSGGQSAGDDASSSGVGGTIAGSTQGGSGGTTSSGGASGSTNGETHAGAGGDAGKSGNGGSSAHGGSAGMQSGGNGGAERGGSAGTQSGGALGGGGHGGGAGDGDGATAGSPDGGRSAEAGSGGSGGSSGTNAPVCTFACAVDTDCPYPTIYTCVDGGCIETGCHTDADCEAVTPGQVCRPAAQGSTSGCASPCSTVLDCDLGVPVFDADNYVCDRGGCVYQGCNSDAECNSYQAGSRCVETPGERPNCNVGCVTRDDCIPSTTQPAYANPDHYKCDAGTCTFLGCDNDADCAIPNFPVSYVCRPPAP